MLPLQQAYEIQHSILEYLKATFNFKDRAVHEAFYQFITHPEEGIFKGPYVSLKLPFVNAGPADTILLEIIPVFLNQMAQEMSAEDRVENDVTMKQKNA